MTIAFQLIVCPLIATSLILLISVPVVFASPEGWSRNKNVLFLRRIIMNWISLFSGYPQFSHLLNQFVLYPKMK